MWPWCWCHMGLLGGGAPALLCSVSCAPAGAPAILAASQFESHWPFGARNMTGSSSLGAGPHGCNWTCYSVLYGSRTPWGRHPFGKGTLPRLAGFSEKLSHRFRSLPDFLAGARGLHLLPNTFSSWPVLPPTFLGSCLALDWERPFAFLLKPCLFFSLLYMSPLTLELLLSYTKYSSRSWANICHAVGPVPSLSASLNFPHWGQWDIYTSALLVSF